jgi:predicted histone-like DNA-binding protein
MAIKYRVKTKPDNIGNRETTKYYAVPVYKGIVDIKELSEKLSDRSTLTRGDIYGVIIGLVPLIEEYLHDGYAVRIDELGIFTVSASSQGFDNPEQCKPHHVVAKKVCFRAENRLKKNLETVKFERDTKKSTSNKP